MARVYTHILQDQGSVAQRTHYIKDRLYELKELLGAATDEKAFWEAWLQDPDLPVPTGCAGWIQNRVDKLGERIRTDKSEQELMQGLLASLNPCEQCSGLGKLPDLNECDESIFKRCPACNGTGTVQS